jgi:glycosyltransferase involved in cell wall biosynthesis
MRILFVVPYVPNLIRVRPYNLLRYLAEAGHEVTLLTLQSSADEAADVAHLETLLERVIVFDLPKWRSFWNCLRVLPSQRPLQSVFCWQPQLAETLTELVGGVEGTIPFDVVHVEHMRGVRYAQHLKKLGTAVPVVWDSVDSISFLFEQAVEQSKSGFGRLITRLDLNRTRRFEGQVVGEFDQVLVTSPADRDAFLRLRPSGAPPPPITVLPNGTDLDTFYPDETIIREPATLIVSGKMSYHANITMVLHLVEAIMPLVWQQRPDARLLIVGKDPSPAVQALGQYPQITVTGTVPALVPYLQQATIAVAPIPYGAGIQNKVLEAMACATPVVVSSAAAKGVTAVPGEQFLVGRDPAEFAHHVVTLLNDASYRHNIGVNGRHFVQENHDWHKIVTQLTDIYGQLLPDTRSRNL